ncbi:TIR domain-containing protein [Methylocystis iwaonis]|uniref:TIR domain-containing protein n=1 Tax=Methylocystis iwaonis TaxID=2885079 RepID=UPI002E7BEC95|nr:TIR domain-containing protein [Methylocystis iwaonis]
MNSSEELFEIAKILEEAAAASNVEDVSGPLHALSEAANEAKRSFSGSWLGYHSRVYYDDFEPVPAGDHFSQEWGLENLDFTSLGSRGGWQEYQFNYVIDHIRERAGNPDLTKAHQAAKKSNEAFHDSKAEIVSILEIELAKHSDPFLLNLKNRLEKTEPMSKTDFARHWSPKGQLITRDTIALGQGTQVPPHIDVLADVRAIDHSFGICQLAADIAKKAASHLERKNRGKTAAARVGTNVFIGHGRSNVWRELKDFVQDRIGLPWDEFNRVPVAGVTNIARLSEMLDAAAIAFLIMTAEDEMADGEVQARMNVVHEAGLFQGRLGFTKAIVLLEDGCVEFSNIQGLGQIRFPKGKIGASFEEIRRVLEREGLIEERLSQKERV